MQSEPMQSGNRIVSVLLATEKSVISGVAVTDSDSQTADALEENSFRRKEQSRAWFGWLPSAGYRSRFRVGYLWGRPLRVRAKGSWCKRKRMRRTRPRRSKLAEISLPN